MRSYLIDLPTLPALIQPSAAEEDLLMLARNHVSAAVRAMEATGPMHEGQRVDSHKLDFLPAKNGECWSIDIRLTRRRPRGEAPAPK